MNPFLLVHRHVHNYTPTPEVAAAWRDWFGVLGDALIDPGKRFASCAQPVGLSHGVFNESDLGPAEVGFPCESTSAAVSDSVGRSENGVEEAEFEPATSGL